MRVGASQPSLPPQPSYSPFAYRPRTEQPVSVVIPSFARPGNLHHQVRVRVRVKVRVRVS